MIARIFAANGVEFGQCSDPGKAVNPGGCSYENDKIKKALIDGYGKLPQTGQLAAFNGLTDSAILSAMEGLSEPFAVKVSALYWPAFAGFVDARVVFITRPKNSVLASWRRMGWSYPSSSYDAHLAAMEQAKKYWPNHAAIDSENLVNGDLTETENAFVMAGVKLNPITVHNIVDPVHWHC